MLSASIGKTNQLYRLQMAPTTASSALPVTTKDKLVYTMFMSIESRYALSKQSYTSSAND